MCESICVYKIQSARAANCQGDAVKPAAEPPNTLPVLSKRLKYISFSFTPISIKQHIKGKVYRNMKPYIFPDDGQYCGVGCGRSAICRQDSSAARYLF